MRTRRFGPCRVAPAIGLISAISWGQAAPPPPAPSVAPSGTTSAPPPPGSPATQPPPATYPPASTHPPPPGGYPPPGNYPQGNYPPGSYPPPAGYAPQGAPGSNPYPAYQYPQPYGYPPPPAYAQPLPPAGPEFLPYEPGQEIPRGYVLQSRPRRGLIIAGSIMVGVPYFIGLSFGGDLEDEDAWLYVPVLGPWVTLAGKDFSCDENSLDFDCETDRSVRTLLILDGLTQGAGAVMLIYGLASKSQRLVRRDLQSFTVTPHFSARGAGLWATGQF